LRVSIAYPRFTDFAQEEVLQVPNQRPQVSIAYPRFTDFAPC